MASQTNSGTDKSAYDAAAEAIANGDATGHALWLLLSDEHQRDRYSLRPSPWEGPGEYQRVSFADGRDVLVRLRDHWALPTNWGRPAKPSQSA